MARPLPVSSLCRETEATEHYRQFSLLIPGGKRAEVQLNCAPLRDRAGAASAG